MFGFCIIISLFFSSFGESNDLLGPHEEYETSGSHAFTQVSTDQYSPNNVYYLNGFGHLSGLPDYSDGSDANDIRKCSLVNGAPAPFYYPPPGKRPAKLVRNSNLRPFISLIINSFEDSGKTVQATLGIDTNDHFDPHEINTLEHRCEFPAYQTIGNRDDGTMEEEYYQAYGQWQGGSPPSVIEKGRLILVIIMVFLSI